MLPSLLPPSWIVALIGELVNKYLFTTTVNLIPIQIAKKLAQDAMNIENNDNIRKRLTSPSKESSKSNPILSTALSISYHIRIEINNNLLDKEFTEPINSS